MKIAVLILGILGGIVGLVLALMALGIGGLGGAFGAEGASTVVNLSFGAIICSILGIIGGALAFAKPKIAGVLLIVAAIGGVISISLFYAIPGILLFVGGVLAFFVKKEKQAVVTA